MTEAEHLAWCKERAIKELEWESGGVNDAWASMVSDLRKHPETADHPAIMLGMMMMMSGQLSTPAKMREFILGFR